MESVDLCVFPPLRLCFLLQFISSPHTSFCFYTQVRVHGSFFGVFVALFIFRSLFCASPSDPLQQSLPPPGPDHIHMLIISLNQLHHIYEEILWQVIIALIKNSADASPSLLVLPLRLFFIRLSGPNVWPDPAGTDVGCVLSRPQPLQRLMSLNLIKIWGR